MKSTDKTLEGVTSVACQEWHKGQIAEGKDRVLEEVPVALVYNGISHVVMMVTPVDLEDFALGFSLSEGILDKASELLDFEAVPQDKGIELRLSILAERFESLKHRRRNLTGRTGCGLCGAESLDQAILPVAPVQFTFHLTDSAIDTAIQQINNHQLLQQITGAAHAAAWCDKHGNIVLLREDVGRHNALDKLLGARKSNVNNDHGFVLVTSRASYEMVVKAARLAIPALVSVSAPTSLAIEMAREHNVTLVAFTQPDRHVWY